MTTFGITVARQDGSSAIHSHLTPSGLLFATLSLETP